MIKNLKPNKNSPYHQGTYKPINESKYAGDYPIIYRSGWEERVCLYLDKNKDITKWASEPVEILYISPFDNKQHRYYPDFYFELAHPAGKTIKYMIEVKPHGKLSPPKKPRKRTPKAIKNYNRALKDHILIIAKAKFAKAWCAKRGILYKFITERDWHKLFKT